jgi:hypothetical protein
MAEHNPFLLPTNPTPRRACPRCKKSDFTGRNAQGAVTYTCRKCGTKWPGGSVHVIDPNVPPMPKNPVPPPVSFERDRRGEWTEIRGPVSTVPAFRKGAPIPAVDEEI